VSQRRSTEEGRWIGRVRERVVIRKQTTRSERVEANLRRERIEVEGDVERQQ
jgi:hypothetical protein